jgi:hypothetical protein
MLNIDMNNSIISSIVFIILKTSSSNWIEESQTKPTNWII